MSKFTNRLRQNDKSDLNEGRFFIYHVTSIQCFLMISAN